MGQVHHHSVFADVSKGEYSGFPVAIKRLRANEGSSTRVFKVPSTNYLRTISQLLSSGFVEKSLDGDI